jgi:protease IV
MESSEKKGKSGCFRVFIVLGVLVLLGSLAMNLVLMGALALTNTTRISATGPVDEQPEFETVWSFGDGETTVVRIPLQGLITREVDGGLFGRGYDRVEMVLNQVRAATRDVSVRGILFEIDSPGGAVTPSDEIYHALRLFRASAPDRRVLVFTRDMAASGGYYTAMAADHIMAEPTSLIGSIGVMLQTVNWKDLSERIGVRDTTIKSGANKDMLNPFREPSAEEIAILQALIDSMHARFMRVVAAGRGMDAERVRRLADGRIFTAESALAEGLIDEIGYWDDALRAMATVLDVADVKVIRYERKMEWSEWLMNVRHPLDLRAAMPLPDRPQVMYLWDP